MSEYVYLEDVESLLGQEVMLVGESGGFIGIDILKRDPWSDEPGRYQLGVVCFGMEDIKYLNLLSIPPIIAIYIN